MFDAPLIERLRQGVEELSWLLTRGYAEPSSLKLVGDRYTLPARARSALLRCACSDQSLKARTEKYRTLADVQTSLAIDGFNLVTILESAMCGGIVLRGRDGVYRDMASVHGNYRLVEVTEAALRQVGELLKKNAVTQSVWYLDRPVSNSGRLAERIRQVGKDLGLEWEAETVWDPDPVLIDYPGLCASSDGMILEKCQGWVNLLHPLIESLENVWLIDLS